MHLCMGGLLSCRLCCSCEALSTKHALGPGHFPISSDWAFPPPFGAQYSSARRVHSLPGFFLFRARQGRPSRRERCPDREKYIRLFLLYLRGSSAKGATRVPRATKKGPHWGAPFIRGILKPAGGPRGWRAASRRFSRKRRRGGSSGRRSRCHCFPRQP